MSEKPPYMWVQASSGAAARTRRPPVCLTQAGQVDVVHNLSAYSLMAAGPLIGLAIDEEEAADAKRQGVGRIVDAGGRVKLAQQVGQA